MKNKAPKSFPWHENYPKGVPYEINPLPRGGLNDWFEKVCEEEGNRVAFEQMGASLRYGHLKSAADKISGYFQHIGLEKGARIALLMPNVFAYPVCVMAALQGGYVVVGNNPLYTEKELYFQLKDAQAKVIVVLENFAQTLSKALILAKKEGETLLEHIIITRFADMFPPIKRRILHFGLRHIKRMIPPYHLEGAVFFHDILQSRAPSFQSVSIDADDPAFFQYTGGTTGISKAAVLSHGNILANVAQVRAWMQNSLTHGKEVVVTALPLYHIFALTVNFFTFFSLGAKNILIANARDIGSFIQQIARAKFTVLTGVNTLFRAMLAHRKFDEIDTRSLKFSVAGGMALQSAIAHHWHEKTHSFILEGYGLSETSPVVSVNPLDGTQREGTIGLPMPHTEIRIYDAKNNVVEAGGVGELCVRGPQVMKGYWRREEENKKAFIDGFFRTGDIAKQEKGGFFRIMDRKKDIVLVGGFNVYPNEVEEVLIQHKDVAEVGVIGVEGIRKEECICAFVVKKEDGLNESALRAFVKAYLAVYKRPRHYVFVEQLPKTNVGKVLRRELKNLWEKQIHGSKNAPK